MFMGQHYSLYRQTIARYLDISLLDRHLHTDVYGIAQPLHRTLHGGTTLSEEDVSIFFQPCYTTRTADWLTPMAMLLHILMRHNLLP